MSKVALEDYSETTYLAGENSRTTSFADKSRSRPIAEDSISLRSCFNNEQRIDEHPH